MDPRVWASAHDFGTFVLSAYAQKPVLLKFAREYGVGVGVLVCMWGVWFPGRGGGGTLIFSYIRRLRSFIGVRNFEF